MIASVLSITIAPLQNDASGLCLWLEQSTNHAQSLNGTESLVAKGEHAIVDCLQVKHIVYVTL